MTTSRIVFATLMSIALVTALETTSAAQEGGPILTGEAAYGG